LNELLQRLLNLIPNLNPNLILNLHLTIIPGRSFKGAARLYKTLLSTAGSCRMAGLAAAHGGDTGGLLKLGVENFGLHADISQDQWLLFLGHA